MRITLSSSALSSRLGTLAKVINSKNSLAILDCFLFEVANNQLTITASDSENVMRTTMPLETSDGEGKFAVNNHTILDAVKELPEQPLTLDVDTNTFSVKIIYQNGIYNFTAQNAEEYPVAQPMPETATSLTMPSNVLGDNIYGYNEDSLEGVVQKMLIETKRTVSVAESDAWKPILSV